MANMARIVGERVKAVDVFDYSRGGCAFVSDRPVEVGDLVRIGSSDADSRECKIVWRDGNRYGCIFPAPLDEADMAQTFEGAALIHVQQHGAAVSEPQDPSRFSRRTRALIFIVGAAAAWALTIAAVAAVMKIV